MKHKLLLGLAAIFLVLTYTTAFWEHRVGFWIMPITFMLILSLLSVVICLLWLLTLGIKERFKDKKRNVATGILIVILLLTYFQPFSFLLTKAIEGKDIFIAQREGAANCMTYFKLKEGDRFIDRDVCFGTYQVEGKYEIRNDTIYFYNVESVRTDKVYYQFAIISKDVRSEYDLGTLTRYRYAGDTIVASLWIVKNELN